MLTALTTFIGLFARGPNAKAIAGTVSGLLTLLFGPEVLDAFQSGFQSAGLLPAAELLGTTLGAVVLGAVNWSIVWLSPKNTDA